MRSAITATILFTAWAATAEAQAAPMPECKADRSGDILVTTVQYDDGYRVEAPWKVTSQRKLTRTTRLTAILDHIIETNPFTRKRELTALPGAIEMTFKGSNSNEILREAADLWCATVAKALAARPTNILSRVAENRQVM